MPSAVIITAIAKECLAVCSHLTELKQETHPQGTIYEKGTFSRNGNCWDVAIVEIGAGNPGAGVETERAISFFKPDVVLFVGVAGGIKDVKLGDVVASTKVYAYESGKSEEKFKPRPEIGLSGYNLEQLARAIAREWLRKVESSSSESNNNLPKAFVAPIAAGEQVVASTESEVFKFLRRNYSDAIAVEMEGFGFLKAARANQQVTAIVIRGISDLIDGKAAVDKAGYQEIAAGNASAFAFEMLGRFRSSNSPSHTGETREYLLDLLNGLLPSQFDTVVFKYHDASFHLANGSQNQKAINLIQYAIQKEGPNLAKLLAVIYEVAPHLRK